MIYTLLLLFIYILTGKIKASKVKNTNTVISKGPV